MKRGDIWTVAGAKEYLGKPRPAVIIQSDRFDATNSVTLCAFTSAAVEAPLARPLINPSDKNGLALACRLMVDKIDTVPKNKLGKQIGRLDEADLARLNRAIVIFLDLGEGVGSNGSANL